jgi:putative addiction module component (TIGR02574 family)
VAVAAGTLGRYRARRARERIADILELGVAERIMLVEEIWDRIAMDSATVPVTEAQRAELVHRLTTEEAEAPTVAWAEVRRRLLLNQ